MGKRAEFRRYGFTNDDVHGNLTEYEIVQADYVCAGGLAEPILIQLKIKYLGKFMNSKTEESFGGHSVDRDVSC